MFHANAEPSLDEMLDDPVVQLRMIGAGLKPENVRACIVDTRRRLCDHDAKTKPAGEPNSAEQ
jgi:hypothetical protein